MMKLDDMQKTTHESVDATARSFEGATKATQAIAAEVADYTRRSFEDGAQTMEKLLRAKSPDKAFEVQTEYAKAAYEGYVSYATRLGQLYGDLGKEAFKSYQDFASKLTPVR
jgi:phasin family protein